jgi:hypothetical protein
MKTCPWCLSEIPDQAKKCKYCAEYQDEKVFKDTAEFQNWQNIKTIRNIGIWNVLTIIALVVLFLKQA